MELEHRRALEALGALEDVKEQLYDSRFPERYFAKLKEEAVVQMVLETAARFRVPFRERREKVTMRIEGLKEWQFMQRFGRFRRRSLPYGDNGVVGVMFTYQHQGYLRTGGKGGKGKEKYGEVPAGVFEDRELGFVGEVFLALQNDFLGDLFMAQFDG